MFNCHCWSLRPVETSSQPGQEHAVLRLEHGDSIYRHSLGGIAPSGWSCVSLPYVVEIDNWASSGKQGQSGVGFPWVWGYDEISWFAHQEEAERNRFLVYAASWIRKADTTGHLQLPTRRYLAIAANGTDMYQTNRKSSACPTGFNQEDTIRELFAG